MHRLAYSFVLGYHGCDKEIAEKVLGGTAFKPSHNEYDWLGDGIYFWEANPIRGLEYASELKSLKRGPKISEPCVVGAVIDLGLCLDLTTSVGIQHVQVAHKRLVTLTSAGGGKLPENGSNQMRRNLDCAVIRVLHDIRKESGNPPIDSVRGVFTEGDAAFAGSGFFEKTHVQICVCNPNCIKGVFRVPADQLS